jgi:hypothetical protein
VDGAARRPVRLVSRGMEVRVAPQRRDAGVHAPRGCREKKSPRAGFFQHFFFFHKKTKTKNRQESRKKTKKQKQKKKK